MGEGVDPVKQVQQPEDEFLDEDELFELPAGPSHQVDPLPARLPVHDVPAKKRKVSQSDELVCNLARCPAAISGHVFKNSAGLRKHHE